MIGKARMYWHLAVPVILTVLLLIILTSSETLFYVPRNLYTYSRT